MLRSTVSVNRLRWSAGSKPIRDSVDRPTTRVPPLTGVSSSIIVAASSALGIHSFQPGSIRLGLLMKAKVGSSADLALVASMMATYAIALPRYLSASRDR